MNSIQKLLTTFDAFQQKHPILAFPLAVVKKFGDDQAGYHAALITYYGFLALFPLFMVGLSVLPLIAGNNPELQTRIIGAALDYFPVFGDDLQRNIVAYRAHGLALIAGLLFAFYGARGIANVLQDVSNAIWQIPKNKRPGFPLNTLRSMGIITVGGTGLIVTTVALSFVAVQTGWGVAGKVLLAVAALVLNTLVFWLIARLATVNKVATKSLLVGAVSAACFWLLLQLAGTTLVIHQLKGASALYGIFAVVLGLLFWLYLQAELYVYALEVNAVKSKKLWPRQLFGSPDRASKSNE